MNMKKQINHLIGFLCSCLLWVGLMVSCVSGGDGQGTASTVGSLPAGGSTEALLASGTATLDGIGESATTVGFVTEVIQPFESTAAVFDTDGSTGTVSPTGTAAETVMITLTPDEPVTNRPGAETAAPVDPNAPIVPTFSHEGGLYTERVGLTMTAPEGYIVRYTTSGSVPTASSSQCKGMVRINYEVGTARVVRAACFDANNKRVGPVVTHTYVMVEEIASPLYTVMISLSSRDFSTLVNNCFETIEKPAHVEIVTPEGERVISQDAGLRIFGGSSRSHEQKSFKLVARKDGYFGENVAYTGKGTFHYPLFSNRMVKAGENAGQVLDRYDSFILRNGGNDSPFNGQNSEDATLLRDGLANNFAATVCDDLEYSYSQFAVVYVNGEYYGILDMREEMDDDFIKRVWGVDDADVNVIKSELDTNRSDGCGDCRFCGVWFYYESDDAQELKDWEMLCRSAIAAIDASDAAYAKAFEEVAAKVDLDSFKEYMALGIYLSNGDWPHNNVKLYRYTGEAVEGIEITDGKFRFMTRDMDMCFARYTCPEILPELDNSATVDMFWRTLGNYVDGYSAYYVNDGETRLYSDSLYLQGLFAFCMRNDDFRADFASFCQKLMSKEANTALKALYKQGYDQIVAEIPKHIYRWGGWSELTFWKNSAGRILTYINARNANFKKHLDLALSMYES